MTHKKPSSPHPLALTSTTPRSLRKPLPVEPHDPVLDRHQGRMEPQAFVEAHPGVVDGKGGIGEALQAFGLADPVGQHAHGIAAFQDVVEGNRVVDRITAGPALQDFVLQLG